MKVALISCVKSKLNKKALAKEMYTSSLFKKSLEYSESIKADKIYVLSAKYGLLRLDEKIEPYDVTLNNMDKSDRENWGKKVIEQLKDICDLKNDEFIILAGKKYYQGLIKSFSNYSFPLENLSYGNRLKKLNSLNEMDVCKRLHIEVNKLKKYTFPFDDSDLPKNGIYILFERGEQAHGVDRIVRIGTHTGEDNLINRLNEHFIKKNKDRSIFRKNIGIALLNKRKDDFLRVWNLDMTKKSGKEKYKDILNPEYQKHIEDEVSDYIQNNFKFSVIEVMEKDKRLFYESKLISTVSNCKNCYPSDKWLGNFSTKEKIRKSGLWLVNELYKSSFSNGELKEFIENYIFTKERKNV